MSNNISEEKSWPFPKSHDQSDNVSAEDGSADPAEEKLAEDNVRHDKKVTEEIDSTVQGVKESN